MLTSLRHRLVASLPNWLKSFVKRRTLAWISTGKKLGRHLPGWVKPFLKRRALAWIAPKETFCALAWKHLQINPEGTATLCCRAVKPITDPSGQPMSLDTHSLDKIWNSAYMQEVRRKMAVGEPVSDCSSCYVEELKTRVSYRTHSNDRWLATDGLSLDEAIQQARRGEYPAQGRPVFFQLNLGNLCNLKCRMCNSSYSSQIENDSVHSQWAPRTTSHESGLGRWSGTMLILKPGAARDVTAEGMTVGQGPRGVTAWIGSSGAFSIPLSGGDQVTSLEIQLGGTSPEVRLSVNGTLLFSGVSPPDGQQRLDLNGVELGRGLQLKVESVAALAIEEIRLQRTSHSAKQQGSNNVLTTRFDSPGDWYTQDSVLFDEILGDLDHLQELYFTGGEPFLSKKFHAILDHLVRHGVAGRMTLQINSNITKLTDEILEKLRHFRTLTMTLSIDGAGSTYEYIRYPAHWSTVARNAQRFRELKNATLLAMPVITMYNALTITELYRFFEEQQIPYGFQACGGPEWLMLKVMPPAGLELAAQRCRDFAAKEARPQNRPHLEALAEHLLSHRPWHMPHLLPVFSDFTNDLDASRGQSFTDTFPELVQILADSGYPWSSRTRHLVQLGLPTRKAS